MGNAGKVWKTAVVVALAVVVVVVAQDLEESHQCSFQR